MMRFAAIALLSAGALGCSNAGGDDSAVPADLDAATPDLALPGMPPGTDDLDVADDAAGPGDDAGGSDDAAAGPDLYRAYDMARPPPDFASPPDLTMPKVNDPKNPFAITLTDITLAAFGGQIQGGRSKNNMWGAGTGAAIGDLDGDGLNDVILARNDDPQSDKPGGPGVFFRNGGAIGGYAGPHFISEPSFSKLVAGRLLHAVALGDYDRDGDLDVMLGGTGRDVLLQNDGNGNFTDVTAMAGVAGRADDLTTGVLFADLNLDGLPDLYIVNFNMQPPIPNDIARKRLYLNLGDGTFADVSQASGTDHTGAGHAAAVFDLDGSGYPNILIANDRFSSDGQPGQKDILPDVWFRLQRIDDQGVPIFADAATSLGIVNWRSNMGISIADLDGDLTPDFYMSDIGKKWMYLNPKPGTPVVESTDKYALGARQDFQNYYMITWGHHFLDLDRDGLLELVMNNGFIYDPQGCESFHQAPFYLRQAGKAQMFVNVTTSVGIKYDIPVCQGAGGDPDRATNRGIAIGDLDGDDDDDVIFGSYAGTFQVYRNDTPAFKHMVRVRLRGTVSAPDPIGATMIVTRKDGSQQATFRYAGGDLYSFSDGVLTLGAGDDGTVMAVQIKWPSGWTQEVDQLPGFAMDQLVTITEPAWLTVEPRVVRPGEAPAKLVYRPVDGAGGFLNLAGAGRRVQVVRSDGFAVNVIDNGDGSYTADIPHPGLARRTTLAITVDGKAIKMQPMMNFK